MRMRRTCIALAAAAAVAATGWVAPARAQDYFGKNQVQYKNFDWHVIETEHFLVHYYPSEHLAAMEAARMAERDYERLSRIFGHEFREKKPIMVFASRADFGQNNVTGDLGEGTAGVTEPLRHRMLLPFTGDFRSFEHVLTHEMVHEFQFDIFARGRAGGGLNALAQVNPPGWFMEGMAEYLSLGPTYMRSSTVMRDAALNGNLPTIVDMTENPGRYDAYRFGQPLWAYVASRFGDEVIGAIMSAVPSIGIERAFKRETGKSLDELGDEWKEDMQTKYLPGVAALDRPRKFAQPLLSERRSGGQVFLAPALSPDGKYIAFLSNGSFLRGQVFIDLWLADAHTGKRVARLVKSTFDPNYQEVGIIYSQSAFSPDGRHLAFTALAGGKEVLYLLDVKKRKRVARIELPLEGVTGPSWSPDGRHLVFSGSKGGITDLYEVDADGRNFRQLTNDLYGDVQPQWSPDGTMIAFATDRGPGADLRNLKFPFWQIAIYHLDQGAIEVLPNQEGLNLNPQWAPDSKSIAYVTDRTGIQNVFLYDIATRQHFQLTNVIGGVLAVTEYSPAISWAHQADRLAFVYYEDGEYTVWSVDNPRLLKRLPYEKAKPATTVARADSTRRPGVADSGAAVASGQSFYRTPSGFRNSADLPGASEQPVEEPVSVAALLDSGALVLPDSSRFKTYKYHIRFSPDFVAQPTIGYTRDNFGNGVFGGTAIVLSDMVGNNHLAIAGAINGRLSDAQFLTAYTNLAHRFQYTGGVLQQPFYFGRGPAIFQDDPSDPNSTFTERDVITRYLEREAFGVGIYPFDRFRRAEVGLQLTNLQRSDLVFSRQFNSQLFPISDFNETEENQHTKNYVQPFAALVSDNVLWGAVGPIYGRRYRFQVQPTLGDFHWMGYLADYRRYDAILFNYLTLATRVYADLSVGRDADTLKKYLGYTDLVRGYDANTFGLNNDNCPLTVQDVDRCDPLLGSRVVVANAELRFPLIRGGGLGGVIPIPAIEGAVFYDVGTSWFDGQTVHFSRGESNLDPSVNRYLLTSHGFEIRANLFNYVILRWDYVIPHDAPNRKGFWQFSLYPPF